MNPLLELKGVTKRYGPNTVLDDVSITVAPNEVIGLIGENGAGKSTLLKILAGVHRQDEGSVLLGGKETRFTDPSDAFRHGVGVVHQEQSLLPNLTVAENLSLGNESDFVTLGFLRKRARRDRARKMLAVVESTVDPGTMTEDLGFAQRQMIEVARAVGDKSTAHPPLLVLDEPTSVLEPEDIEVLYRQVQSLREIGSVIFVSHRLDEVLRFSDRVYVLRDGKMVGERDAKTASESDLYSLMIGKDAVDEIYCVERKSDRNVAATEAPVLAARDVNVGNAVKNVSLDVAAGEVVCLVGVAASGREEFVRSLFGATPLRSGSVTLDGVPLRADSPAATVAAGVAYVPAERRTEGMIAGATVADNIALVHPTTDRGNRSRAARAMATTWIERLKIRPADPDTDIARLSGGNQQKAVLAKWIMNEDLRLLILDHPTRGLDIGAKEDVYALVRDLSDRGVAVLVLADTLDEAIGLGHRVIVLRDGEVTAEFESSSHSSPSKVDILEKMM